MTSLTGKTIMESYRNLKAAAFENSSILAKQHQQPLNPDAARLTGAALARFEFCTKNSQSDDIKNALQLDERDWKRLSHRYARLTQQWNGTNAIPLFGPAPGLIDLIPLDVETLIFKSLPTFKDMVRWGCCSKRRRSIVRNIKNWHGAVGIRRLLNDSTCGHQDQKHLFKLLRLLAENPQTVDFARQLGCFFFNQASDEALRLFTNRIDDGDRKFYFDLIKDQPLDRKTISLGGLLWIKTIPYDLTWVLAKLPNLEKLSLSGCVMVDDKDLEAVGRLVHLKALHIWGCANLTGSGFGHLQRLQELEYLDISGCVALKPENLASLGGLKVLKKLDMSKLRNVLPEHLTFLTSLSLDECKR